MKTRTADEDISSYNTWGKFFFGRNDIRGVQQKSFVRRTRTKDFANIRNSRLRRWRRFDINVRLGFGLSRRRRIHDCRVALFFLRRWIGDGRFFLFTSREQCGTHKKADVFVHVRF